MWRPKGPGEVSSEMPEGESQRGAREAGMFRKVSALMLESSKLP